jgi:hypothetical protein
MAGVNKPRRFRLLLENIVTYLRHRITTPPANPSIRRFNGSNTPLAVSRSKTNFIPAIYFHCGGLNLMPTTSEPLIELATLAQTSSIGCGMPGQFAAPCCRKPIQTTTLCVPEGLTT